MTSARFTERDLKRLPKMELAIKVFGFIIFVGLVWLAVAMKTAKDLPKE